MPLEFIEVKDANGVTHEIAVDKIGTRNYQFVKMAYGDDDAVTIVSSANPVPVTVLGGSATGTEYTQGAIDATPSGPVLMISTSGDVIQAVSPTNPMPTTMAPGSTLELTGELEISADAAVIQITPTISTVAYTAGDTLGGLLSISNAYDGIGAAAVLQSIVVFDKANQNAPIDFIFFNASGTVPANNNPFTWNTADFVKVLGRVRVASTDYLTLNSRSFASVYPIGLTLQGNATQALYVVAIVQGTPTYTSTSDLIFSFGLLRD